MSAAPNLNSVDYPSLLLSKDSKDVTRSFEDNYVNHIFKYYQALKVPVNDIVRFFHKAQITGANPVMDQIFLIPRNTKIKGHNGQQDRWETVGTIVFHYSFLELKAHQSGEYEGYESETGPDNYFDPIKLEERKMLRSKVAVTRKGRRFTFIAWWDEYVQTNQYGVTAQWKGKPAFMIEKCALAGALRRAFPEWLTGVYAQEELGAIEKDDDAIETTFKQQAEVAKVAEIEERIEKKLLSTEQVEKVDGLIEAIRIEMATLTKGANAAKKGLAMHEHLGVTKFEDLKKKPLEELEVLLPKVKAVNEEMRMRASAG
jgi:phage recombination protein Bet